MSGKLVKSKAQFGTAEVFVTSVSTILGAILFLRFGWAVGNLGFVKVLGIILIGHLVTIPTAFAVAEIATNQRVLGGGAYYIISRSFGLNIGAAIGVTLYASQAISVAFYVIAFAEAFDPVLVFINNHFGIEIVDKRFISIPIMLILSLIAVLRGANVGMKALYGVALVLGVSLLLFFTGKINGTVEINAMNNTVSNPTGFFYVFTIIFPAFTGLAAGLGLSGDLKDPTRSIPRGTLLATIVGVVVYIGVAYKLAISASPEDLVADQLIMQRIATWGPIIPIGLAAASLSSAIGSILVAPRTLQAIGADNIIPNKLLNRLFAKTVEKNNEPRNATIITVLIAFIFVGIGSIDFVAQIISMFFMITYGAICVISLLEHFAADPAYRPTFRSKWYISLVGTILSFWLMFKMDATYAFVALVIMAIVYYSINNDHNEHKGFGKLFRGVIFQLSRQLQILAQRANKEDYGSHWRPFVICISSETFQRRSAFDLLRWMSYKYGFGTYIHFIEGYLSKKTSQESKDVMERMIALASGTKNKVYVETIISPSYTSAIAQVVQLSGVSGRGNNTILFEFSRTDTSNLKRSLENYALIFSTGFDICILSSSYKGFGYKKEVHVWITTYDYENANLMILFAYILLGHPEWKNGIIKIFSIYRENELDEKRDSLLKIIKSGRLPISPGNIELIPYDRERGTKQLISQRSMDADLTIVGFRQDMVKAKGMDIFTGFDDNMGNVLFVNSQKEKEIS